MRRNVLIVGAGGVGHVVAHKCAQHNDVLGDIHLASRTIEKCRATICSIYEKRSLREPSVLEAHALDALDIVATQTLIERTGSQIIINVGSPYVNMSVLSACIATGAAYIDTALHEDPLDIWDTPPWYAEHEWKRRDECREAGVTAVLGVGFDPGVVNAYAALAKEVLFDRIDSIDIVDVNGGNHGRYFATNFDPEINLREFMTQVWSWQDSKWTSNEMFEVRKDWDLPVVGKRATYLTGHDEIHSLSQILDVPTVRFWMGFNEHYISVFNMLKNLGLLSERPVRTAEGQEVVPLKVVKAVLPNPSSLAPDYTGNTCIGDVVKGVKNGRAREVLIYSVADHAETYREVGSQAISYTAGVPPVAAAILIARGTWNVGRMAHVEEMPPAPFLDLLNRMGLPSRIKDADGDRLLAL